jgi:hypothetical protein
MQEIALGAPADQVDRYSSAADSFRIPYWDWAQGKAGGGVPAFFTDPSIVVSTPDGTEREMSNPLYAYRFRPLIPGDFTGKVGNFRAFPIKADRFFSGLKSTPPFDGRQLKIRGRARETTGSHPISWACNAHTKMVWRWPFEKAV